MVAFYKHDIAAWMDATEGLSDGCYRVYHVVCQLIYQNEGPIRLNTRGLAGRCNQRVEDTNRYIKELIAAKKLKQDDDRIYNSRCDQELGKIEENRINAAKGGKASGARRRATATEPLPDGLPPAMQPPATGHGVATKPQQQKLFENNDDGEAALDKDRSLRDETRPEKTREESAKPTKHTRRMIYGTRIPDDWSLTPERMAVAQKYGLREVETQGIARKFRHHWTNAPGQRGLKIDWEGTWDVWVEGDAKKLGRVPAVPNGGSDPTTYSRETWQNILKLFKMTSNWKPEHGPAPGRPGCIVPPHLLKE